MKLLENKYEPLKLNLQFFADGDETPPADPPVDLPADPPAKLELTQDEIDKKVEAESDRKLNKALEKKQKEWQQQQQKAIDDALAEKDRLSRLSEKERKEEAITKREKEIADRESEIARKEMRSEAVDDLQKKDLPSDFADFLLADNAENTLKNINAFKDAFDKAVNAAVKTKLRQDTPPAGGNGGNTNKVPSIAEMAKENRLIK